MQNCFKSKEKEKEEDGDEKEKEEDKGDEDQVEKEEKEEGWKNEYAKVVKQKKEVQLVTLFAS